MSPHCPLIKRCTLLTAQLPRTLLISLPPCPHSVPLFQHCPPALSPSSNTAPQHCHLFTLIVPAPLLHHPDRSALTLFHFLASATTLNSCHCTAGPSRRTFVSTSHHAPYRPMPHTAPCFPAPPLKGHLEPHLLCVLAAQGRAHFAPFSLNHDCACMQSHLEPHLLCV